MIFVLFYLETKNEPKEAEKFMVELLEAAQKQPLIVSSQDEIEDRLDEIEREATILSDKKRRVQLESVKPNRQAVMNAPILKKAQPEKKPQPQGGAPDDDQQVAENRNFESVSPDGLLDKYGRKPLELPFSPQPLNAAAYVPDYIQQTLPNGIELGNVTALNTDQHLYYNFHSRLIGRFAPLWASMVSRSLYRWLQENNFPSTPQSWVTNVEVILDKNGEVLDVQHFRMSGLWPFDEAPVKAFKQIKQIPNPPAEMVDDNGYIRLKFQTEVHWRPSPSAKFGLGPRSR